MPSIPSFGDTVRETESEFLARVRLANAHNLSIGADTTLSSSIVESILSMIEDKNRELKRNYMNIHSLHLQHSPELFVDTENALKEIDLNKIEKDAKVSMLLFTTTQNPDLIATRLENIIFENVDNHITSGIGSYGALNSTNSASVHDYRTIEKWAIWGFLLNYKLITLNGETKVYGLIKLNLEKAIRNKEHRDKHFAATRETEGLFKPVPRLLHTTDTSGNVMNVELIAIDLAFENNL